MNTKPLRHPGEDSSLIELREEDELRKARPFLKWAGGKKQLLGALTQRMPRSYGRYFEPMVGGGALFFAVAPDDAYISDTNPELINAYRMVQTQVDPLLADLLTHVHTEEYFYQLRNVDRSEEYERFSDLRKASRLIYLNKTCFNGLYRVSAKGYFNTPFGDYVKPKIADEPNLRACSRVLRNCAIGLGSFEHILSQVQRNDFVYLTPSV